MKATSLRAAFGALVATATLTMGGLVASPTAVGAQTNPYERGPDPTDRTLEASRGPFAVRQQSVSAPSGAGFNRGTVYYPTDTSQGTFGGIVAMPGFMTPEIGISWTGPRIASHGFVVLTLEPNNILDFPNARASQMEAALEWLADGSPVADQVDGSRLGVMGHSMGGGGSLEAARDNPDLQAAVPLQPWDMFVNFRNVQVPTMVIGAQNDAVAAVASHSEPFYEQISGDKAYLELAGQGHTVGVSANATQAKYAVAWFKRFIDDDTRYDQFLCPAPSGNTINEYRASCPNT